MHLSVAGTSEPLTGEVVVPNSKYHAHRALILASLAPGTSTVHGLSDAHHVHYTVELLRALGVRVEISGDTFVVHGGGYHPVRETVTAGSSGTTLYFMIGLASLADAPVTVTGQKYFQRRPVAPLLRALEQMGVRLSSADGCPPIQVQPHRPTGGRVQIPGTLSQWISGLVLLAPFATGRTVIEVEGELNERTYLRLTVDMMRRFGLAVDVADDWRTFTVDPNQQAVPATVTLPPDIGSAAFGLAAAAIHRSDVLFHGLTSTAAADTDHPEAELLSIVAEMGLDLDYDAAAGAVRVRHDGSPLAAAEVDCRDLPDMLPVLSTMATFARGTTVLRNVGHARLKESDRASAMLQLNRMGGRLELADSTLRVHGVPALTGASMSSFNDHRVLMSLAVAASRAAGRSSLTYPNAYRISYPEFLTAMNGIGIPMSVADGSGTGRPRRPRSRQAPASAQVPISEWVQRWATERPHATAVVDVRPGSMHTHTWQELMEQADRVATLLLDLGVGPGDRVAFQLPNWFEFVVISLATLRIGAVCCPLMPIFREREMAFALRRSRAKVLFVPDSFRGRDHRQEVAALLGAGMSGSVGDAAPADAGPGLDALTDVVVVPASDSGADRLRLPDGGSAVWHSYPELLRDVTIDVTRLGAHRPGADATAQLLFTSGTSGEPKAALMQGRSLTAAALMEVRHLGLGTDDTVFIPSPLAHQTGFLYGMWLAFVVGAPQVIQGQWSSSRALRAMRDHRVSFVQAATPFLADLVKGVEDGDRAPESLRIFVATGAAVPRGLAERATRVLGTTVCGAWGTTETCLGTLAAPGDEPAKTWGTDGRALDGITIRIVDDEGRKLPPGVEGNFELRSPTFFEGYLDHPEWTADAFTADGFFRTGDLGIIDESGYIRITGRVKDVINRGGEKVPVSEIEQLLYEHPSVAEVAIVAMPDPRLGERACAFVVPAPHADLDFGAMQKYLNTHQVAKTYWPERLELVDELPRNPTGKIQKYLLRERARALRPERDGVQ
ncbi:3-phosphoshikimate 1-carboxyvinyltransferase [Actinocatenispora sera]|uniref:3-phosphoshikimate 1-carboxyvinyltransferase n=1 Tax=Actinocatenispora sera TaxID=390989 RepID=UPI0033E4D07C